MLPILVPIYKEILVGAVFFVKEKLMLPRPPMVDSSQGLKMVAHAENLELLCP